MTRRSSPDPLAERVTIRPFAEGDEAAVAALWRRAGLTVPYNDPYADIAFCRATPTAELFVAEDPEPADGVRIVATAMAGYDGHRGWLYYVATDPRRARRGLGRRIVARAEKWLAARGVRKINLLIREDNADVRAFYARIGFEETPRIVMARWLDDTDPAAGGGAAAVEDEAIETTVTYLEMRAPPRRAPRPAPLKRLAILRAERPTISFYRYLYERVGAEWNWTERRLLDDRALAEIIQDERVEIYVLYVAGTPAGYVELDRRVPGEVELAYFGLLPEFVGQGLGAYFLDWAVAAAWSSGPERVWLHTCDLDHPRALSVYQRAGFVPYRQQVERVPTEAAARAAARRARARS